jgi:4-amino-4-deoxy-L-arabinose transferase-like glycosyltransferase
VKVFKRPKIIFFTALFLRILFVVFFGDKNLDYEFDVLVKNLINGNGYTYWSVTENNTITNEFVENAKIYIPSAYMPILYPLFLSSIVFFIGFSQFSIFIILLIQSLIGVINCFMIRDIYKIKFGSKNAHLVAWLVALFPLHIFMSSQISASTLYVFFMGCVLYFYNKIRLDSSYKNIAYLSISLGLLTLTRADAILLIPAIFILLTLFHKKVHIKKSFIMVLLSLIVIMPLSMRNFNHFGFFYPLTISSGLNLWIGNNKDATGSRLNYVEPYKPIPDSILNKIDKLEINNYYEINRDDIFKIAALDFIKNNPVQVVQLSMKKIAFFWVHIFDERIKYPNLNNILYWGPWIILLPFFLFSFPFIIKNWRKNDLELFLILYFTFVYSVFFVLPRYRLIVLPIYTIYSFYYFNKKFIN